MHDNMARIPGGGFTMGSAEHYREEGPPHPAGTDAFLLDRHPVTNRQFRRFVEATGYVTVAEQALSAAEYPQLAQAERAPGSLVFQMTRGPVDLRNWRAWWHWVPGASWLRPFGPGSSTAGKDGHPVVQVCYTDATAYASWAGARLPTEVEWELAARGGAPHSAYAWGDELHPDGRMMANTWQGEFPYRNDGAAGWRGTSPVGTFPPNGYGLVDMIGNVWEWTSSRYNPDHRVAAGNAARLPAGATMTTEASPDGCACSPGRGAAAAEAAAADPTRSRVTKGGSHLCAPEYCRRYRPAARSPQTQDSATTHLGFRCARSLDGE